MTKKHYIDIVKEYFFTGGSTVRDGPVSRHNSIQQHNQPQQYRNDHHNHQQHHQPPAQQQRHQNNYDRHHHNEFDYRNDYGGGDRDRGGGRGPRVRGDSIGGNDRVMRDRIDQFNDGDEGMMMPQIPLTVKQHNRLNKIKFLLVICDNISIFATKKL